MGLERQVVTDGVNPGGWIGSLAFIPRTGGIHSVSVRRALSVVMILLLRGKRVAEGQESIREVSYRLGGYCCRNQRYEW